MTNFLKIITNIAIMSTHLYLLPPPPCHDYKRTFPTIRPLNWAGLFMNEIYKLIPPDDLCSYNLLELTDFFRRSNCFHSIEMLFGCNALHCHSHLLRWTMTLWWQKGLVFCCPESLRDKTFKTFLLVEAESRAGSGDKQEIFLCHYPAWAWAYTTLLLHCDLKSPAFKF